MRFTATKLVEKDNLIQEALKIPEDEQKILEQLVEVMERESGMDREAALANMRFSFIEKLCSRTVVKPAESREHKRSVAIDRVLTGKYTAIPCFIGIMGLVFVMTFNFIGAALSDWMAMAVDGVIAVIDRGLTAAGVNTAVHSLVVDGVCQGVGSVLSFLPTIVTLFFFLSILEDTGYMARVAFVMDKLLRKIVCQAGVLCPCLSDLDVLYRQLCLPELCQAERDRKMTILLTPFMSCSAKLPIYSLMTSAFFPRKWQALVMVSLYALGILCGILYALILKKTAFKGEPVPFVMELPNYRRRQQEVLAS